MIKRRARLLAGLTLGVLRRITTKLREGRRHEQLLARARERVSATSDLTGTRVLVTGSTRGIGRALAQAFVEQGASVVVHGRDAAAARAVALELAGRAASGAQVVGIGADLSAPGSGQALVADTLAALGGLDVVVNNAGVLAPALKPIWETGSDEVASVLRVNLVAAFEVCAAAVAHMVDQGVAGRVLMLSTMSAKPGHLGAGTAAYGVSKVALEGLASYLALEVEPHGITVATLRPGMIDTEMIAPLFPLDQRVRAAGADSLVPLVLHLATAPGADVHGRVFDQQELTELLGAAETQ